MPIRKIGRGKFKSPSGKTFNAKQRRAYFATNGFKRSPKAKGKRRR